mmetsp:Transcript_5148/g.6651  ORF Transcript_5148/g.6651 Transcript_5148/m.6651 type:complete len:142 (+) Transcript_5148:80-505(+)
MSLLLTLQDKPSKIHQDNFDPGRGNALQAAVASIFGCALKDVPNFIEMPGGYEASIKTFGKEGGINIIKVAVNSDILYKSSAYETHLGKLCILRGKSPRGNFGHVVVARFNADGFEMVHDPHPEGTMLDTSQELGWCMLFS